VVRISLNSLWTTGFLDLASEPIVLSVPDTKDRYYVMSLMEMWTNVFGSVGKRTTGTAPGKFLIVGPNWQGTAPAGIKQTFRSPTRHAWVLGQTQANGPDDFAAVIATQAEYKLTPGSRIRHLQMSLSIPAWTSIRHRWTRSRGWMPAPSSSGSHC
jgi:hypothetical protein